MRIEDKVDNAIHQPVLSEETVEPCILEQGRKVVEDWASSLSMRQLLGFYVGHGFPQVGYEDEPHRWLARFIENHPREKELGPLFAKSIATFLDYSPDVRYRFWLDQKKGQCNGDQDDRSLGFETPEGDFVTSRPGQLWYNLLLFSASLRQPEHLAEPLSQMFRRKELKGDWRGPSLVGALCDALICNQVDSGLLHEWELMMDNGEHPYLKGFPQEGFRAILKMPVSAEKPYQPNVPAVYAALVKMYHYFEKIEYAGGFTIALADIRKNHPDVDWVTKFRDVHRWKDTSLDINEPIERFFEKK
ncbi:hypothetical protein HYU13_03630 [Candidatus Woesearchaeota archaeon]|nr:hypothetical protein [Candidatus Woesearchaeota archaeon]